ncbi:MAG: hypothetical protein AB7N76_32530 [Planctomycetota bacterium]
MRLKGSLLRGRLSKGRLSKGRLSKGRSRGFALADFVAGMFIFAGVLVTYAALTRAKFQTLEAAESRARALAAAEAEVDRVRREGLSQEPAGDADTDGFRRVRRDEAPKIEGLATALLQVDARALRLANAGARVHSGLLEVRVRVSWIDGAGSSRLDLSTVVPRRAR